MAAGDVVLAGSMGPLRSHASNVRNESSVSSADHQIDLALGLLTDSGRGLSVDALTAVVGEVRKIVTRFDGYVDQYADAVLDYANRVDGLQVQARQLRTDLGETREAFRELDRRLVREGAPEYERRELAHRAEISAGHYEAKLWDLDSQRLMADGSLVRRLDALRGQTDALARQALGPGGSISSLLPPTGGGGIGPHVGAVDGLFVASFMTPQGVANWYESLTDEEKDFLISRYPNILGNLDGVPPEIRDTCNRAVLDARIAEYENALRSGRPLFIGPPGRTPLIGAASIARLRDLLALRNQLTKWDADPYNVKYPLFLLGFDANALHVQAIVAVGDVSEATHIATHVPGMNTFVSGDTVTNALGLLKLQNDLAAKELRLPRGEGDVAGVFFLDYSPPSTLETANPWHPNSGARAWSAGAGGERLTSFSQGLRATSKAPNLRSVVSGHSYGTEVGFYALSDPTHGFDAAIFTGSPGYPETPVHLDQGDLFIAANTNDLVVEGLGALRFHGERVSTLCNVEHLDVGRLTHDRKLYEAGDGHTYYGKLNSARKGQLTSTDLNTALVTAGVTQPIQVEGKFPSCALSDAPDYSPWAFDPNPFAFLLEKYPVEVDFRGRS